MKAATKQPTAKHKAGLSASTIPTPEQGRAEFVRELNKRKRKDDGSESPPEDVQKFLIAVERATANKGSFSALDILRETKGFELDERRVTELTVKYISTLERLGLLEKVITCYDYPIWQRIG